jgi:ribosome-associated translation inhibitor RaiA
MQVLVNSDNHIGASLQLMGNIGERVREKTRRFEDHLTRIEVHLSDENAHKGGSHDKRCVIEARAKGRDPVSASHNADQLHLAVEGAITKLGRVLERDIGKTRII